MASPLNASAATGSSCAESSSANADTRWAGRRALQLRTRTPAGTQPSPSGGQRFEYGTHDPPAPRCRLPGGVHWGGTHTHTAIRYTPEDLGPSTGPSSCLRSGAGRPDRPLLRQAGDQPSGLNCERTTVGGHASTPIVLTSARCANTSAASPSLRPDRPAEPALSAFQRLGSGVSMP